MVTSRTQWLCDVCGAEYDTEERARICETFPVPSCPVQVGQEIKLLNRSWHTYTVAVVRGVRVFNVIAAVGYSTEVIEVFKKVNPHNWLAQLDRNVLLDHKWERPSDAVRLDMYLVSEERAKLMRRCDNCSEGECRHEDLLTNAGGNLTP